MCMRSSVWLSDYPAEYYSGLSFPSPGDLPIPRIEPVPPVASALAGKFFTTEPSGKFYSIFLRLKKKKNSHKNHSFKVAFQYFLV